MIKVKIDLVEEKEEHRRTYNSSKVGPQNVLTAFKFRGMNKYAQPNNYRGDESLGVGDGASNDGERSSSIGVDSASIDRATVAVGQNSRARVKDSTAVGEETGALKARSTVVGRKSISKEILSIVLGSGSGALHERVIIIGNDLFSTANGDILIGIPSLGVLKGYADGGWVLLDASGAAPTGGSKGAGTLNTFGVYKNGVEY